MRATEFIIESTHKKYELFEKLKAMPITVFGSSATKSIDEAGDFDVFLDLDANPDHRQFIKPLLNLAYAYYGWLDPFVLNGGELYVRNDRATGWMLSKNARAMLANIRAQGKPITDIGQELDEGWRDLAAAGVMGVAALGAQAKHAPVQSHTKPAHVQPAKQVAPKVPDLKAAPIPANGMNLLSMNTGAESVLHRVARASGLKGTELAQFMAQTKHESADFSRMKEIGGRDYFHKRYDPRTAPKTAKILGNTKAGDGIRYHGRGFIQITGRDNYRMAGEALGLPLEQQPELAAKPEVAAKIAVWYWKTRVKPNVSNFADTTTVTKYINPALRGLKDRHENFLDYKRIL